MNCACTLYLAQPALLASSMCCHLLPTEHGNSQHVKEASNAGCTARHQGARAQEGGAPAN